MSPGVLFPSLEMVVNLSFLYPSSQHGVVPPGAPVQSSTTWMDGGGRPPREERVKEGLGVSVKGCSDMGTWEHVNSAAVLSPAVLLATGGTSCLQRPPVEGSFVQTFQQARCSQRCRRTTGGAELPVSWEPVEDAAPDGSFWDTPAPLPESSLTLTFSSLASTLSYAAPTPSVSFSSPSLQGFSLPLGLDFLMVCCLLR